MAAEVATFVCSDCHRTVPTTNRLMHTLVCERHESPGEPVQTEQLAQPAPEPAAPSTSSTPVPVSEEITAVPDSAPSGAGESENELQSHTEQNEPDILMVECECMLPALLAFPHHL